MLPNYNENTLHISNLPFDCTEEDLAYLFKDYEIEKLSLVSKQDKKFGRITFTSSQIAKKAKDDLTGICFLPQSSQTGQITSISISKIDFKVDGEFPDETNQRVIIKKIPEEMTGREFYKLVTKFGEVKTIKFPLDLFAKNKGYAEAYYCNEEGAKKCIEEINKNNNDSNKQMTACILTQSHKDNSNKEADNKIPETPKTNLFIKNIPLSYTDLDLYNYFSKYGKISYCSITKNEHNKSRGFGFVYFENPKNAEEALLIENQLKNKLDDCEEPIYVAYEVKREDRIPNNSKIEQCTLFCRLREDLKIKNENDLIFEIQEYLNMILEKKYYPKGIVVNMETKCAFITFHRKKDVDEFMQKYVYYSMNYFPKLFFNYYNKKPGQLNSYIHQINSVANPISMFNKFEKLSVFSSNAIPVVERKFQPNYNNNKYSMNYKSNPKFISNNNNQRKNNYYKHNTNNIYRKNSYHYDKKNSRKTSTNVKNDKNKEEVGIYEGDNEGDEELFNNVYEYVYLTYPELAGKITGMLIDLGVDELKNLYKNKKNLDKLAKEAYDIIQKSIKK